MGVVIISTDNSRIGALDQLQSLARLIDVRFEMAFDEMELNVMLDCYKDAQFVLIDGPAYGCLDEGPLNRLKNYRSIGVDEVHIVLDASNDFHYMMDMIKKSSFSKSATTFYEARSGFSCWNDAHLRCDFQ